MNIPSVECLLGELAELRAERDILKKENRIERNCRIGVEYGFDCANEQIGRLQAEVEYWKKIRTENAIYFEKREAELTAERDELLAKVKWMEGNTANWGWPWDTPFNDGYDACKRDMIEERDAALAEVAEESAVREMLAKLLAKTAVVLKGQEAALFRHSWHDLPEVAEEKITTLKSALREAKRALETCGYADDSTDPEMCGPYLDFNAVVKALATINKVLGEE